MPCKQTLCTPDAFHGKRTLKAGSAYALSSLGCTSKRDLALNLAARSRLPSNGHIIAQTASLKQRPYLVALCPTCLIKLLSVLSKLLDHGAATALSIFKYPLARLVTTDQGVKWSFRNSKAFGQRSECDRLLIGPFPGIRCHALAEVHNTAQSWRLSNLHRQCSARLQAVLRFTIWTQSLAVCCKK